MNNLKFKNNHKLEIYVIPMLEKLGYKEKDIVYTHNDGKVYPVPDYIINKKIAVEVGKLSRDDKLFDLLEEYEKVIWIFSEEKMPLLNCIIYEREGIVRSKEGRIISDKKKNENGIRNIKSEKKIEELKEEIIFLDNDVKVLQNKNETISNQLNAIEEIMKYEKMDYRFGNNEYKIENKKVGDIKGDENLKVRRIIY